MEEHLRVAGQSIVLRRTVNRWVEYAIAAWIMSLIVLAMSRWGGVDLTALVVSLIMLGCAFATVAVVHNLRFLETSRKERVLARRHLATRSGNHRPPA
jgi:ABC-type polysaccharide/polyol phosphate export permease